MPNWGNSGQRAASAARQMMQATVLRVSSITPQKVFGGIVLIAALGYLYFNNTLALPGEIDGSIWVAMALHIAAIITLFLGTAILFKAQRTIIKTIGLLCIVSATFVFLWWWLPPAWIPDFPSLNKLTEKQEDLYALGALMLIALVVLSGIVSHRSSTRKGITHEKWKEGSVYVSYVLPLGALLAGLSILHPNLLAWYGETFTWRFNAGALILVGLIAIVAGGKLREPIWRISIAIIVASLVYTGAQTLGLTDKLWGYASGFTGIGELIATHIIPLMFLIAGITLLALGAPKTGVLLALVAALLFFFGSPFNLTGFGGGGVQTRPMPAWFDGKACWENKERCIVSIPDGDTPSFQIDPRICVEFVPLAPDGSEEVGSYPTYGGAYDRTRTWHSASNGTLMVVVPTKLGRNNMITEAYIWSSGARLVRVTAKYACR